MADNLLYSYFWKPGWKLILCGNSGEMLVNNPLMLDLDSTSGHTQMMDLLLSNHTLVLSRVLPCTFVPLLRWTSDVDVS